MRYEWKITLPGYKIFYSIVFMVLTVMVRPVNSYSGIIAGLEPNVALLAGVFMADNYYKDVFGGFELQVINQSLTLSMQKAKNNCQTSKKSGI